MQGTIKFKVDGKEYEVNGDFKIDVAAGTKRLILTKNLIVIENRSGSFQLVIPSGSEILVKHRGAETTCSWVHPSTSMDRIKFTVDKSYFDREIRPITKAL